MTDKPLFSLVRIVQNGSAVTTWYVVLVRTLYTILDDDTLTGNLRFVGTGTAHRTRILFHS